MHRTTIYRLLHSPAWLALCLALAGLAGIAGIGRAQLPGPAFQNTGGRRYLVAFPDTAINALDPRFPNTRVRREATLWMYSSVKNKVKITTSGGASTILDVNAGQFKTYEVPGPVVVNVVGSPVARSIMVQADEPIILYCYYASPQSAEAWTPLPIEAWGTRYVASMYAGEVLRDVVKANPASVTSRPKAAPSEILVIAAFDNTNVTLRLSPGLRLAGDAPLTVKLNAGQVYQVQSVVNTQDSNAVQDDLAATHITADKPVGVISGNTRSSGDATIDEGGVLNNAYKNMLIEWLSPLELHGSDFVYLPTWDAHRAGIGAPAERRHENVRMYSIADSIPNSANGFYLQPGGTTKISFKLKADTVYQAPFAAIAAAFIHTDEPAQLMMNTTAVVGFNGSTPCGPIPCVSYSAWGAYMVDLAPRQRWTSFAPFYAPPNPGGMQHYINVVTDTLSIGKITLEDGITFVFNRKIPGTDLIWGSMSVTPGASHWLVGKDGAKFWGFVYGLAAGGEEWGPSSYQEYTGVSYGYPLASSINIVGAHDSISINTDSSCLGVLTMDVRIVNAEPAGLRSIRLDTGAVNAQLVGIAPTDLTSIAGSTHVILRVIPVDPLKPASGVVLVTDRTGYMRSVPYNYVPELVTIQPAQELIIENVAPSVAVQRTVKVFNHLAKPVAITSVGFAGTTGAFQVVSTSPSGPALQPPHDVTLAPGDSMIVTFKVVLPSAANLDDTLYVNTNCIAMPLHVVARYGIPVIDVADLDFGTLHVGDPPKTLLWRVCNDGTGVITFVNPRGTGPVVEWPGSGFTIDSASLARLKAAHLGPGECDTLSVTFTPKEKGQYSTMARVWGSTSNRRDTSLWTALVVDGPLAVPGDRLLGDDMQAGTVGSLAVIHYSLAHAADVRIAVYDNLGRPVATLADGDATAGSHSLTWDGAGEPSGMYFCTMSTGSWSRTVPVLIVR